ncbi:MAG: RNA polymerase sigma-54 factor [Rhizobiales bacterium 65-9]|nr:RNA polymerase factor sigma-54 [Hyphomicrobiales bacterium]OJY37415.1 MAG: RNA polymerase sigma-54 factor [Rhizobiales bacterium 65-9]
MALSVGLHLRQSQALVMTPQLLQAIKLLQLSTIELAAYVDAELERNPLLERVEEGAAAEPPGLNADDAPPGERVEAPAEWDAPLLETSRGALESNLDTDLGNAFPDEAPSAATNANDDGLTVSSSVWTGVSGGGGFDGDGDGFEQTIAEARPTLADHLERQLNESTPDPALRFIGRMLIDAIDANGYLSESVQEIAARLGADPGLAETALRLIQGFDPAGIGARDLAECLSIQLREKNRFDPAMSALVGRLDLLAKRDFGALMKICGVDDEDLRDMVREIRALDPKPGRLFANDVAAPVVPDVFVRPAADGSWIVELNSDALPKVLVNQAYYTRVTRDVRDEKAKTFVQDCFQTANWLARSLDQRAKTILKVATEIVRQQDAFFVNGVSELRPLNLRAIADAIGMHESTVSRVTSNKFMATHRGLFEMKYFFTTSIAAANGGDAHSAESVRHRIRVMIDAESAKDVLSDDAIVTKLRDSGVDIARRTVAKYRESLKIPSSVERKREKLAMSMR